jgi:hypothetical protein
LFGFDVLRHYNSELKMTESRRLLAEYVENGSEAAFRELVARYPDFVYSAAIRLTCGLSLNLLDETYNNAYSRASAFLCPDELATFAEFRTNALTTSRVAIVMNRKMMAPAAQ